MDIPHIPVLVDAVLHTFKDIHEGDFLDATLGFGGHSQSLLEQHPKIKLIACDQDEEALNFAKKRLKTFENRTQFIQTNFATIFKQIDSSKLKAVLADIGVSSLQLDKNERGFSLHSDFLDMRMDTSKKLNAFELVNSYPQNKLEELFKNFGELRDYKTIAANIITARAKKTITSAKELASIIGTKKIKGRSVSRAILAFQALRIEVNEELLVLKEFLKDLEEAKPKNCIVAIICFHSLEDSIVKSTFKKWAKACICAEEALQCTCGKKHELGQIITKKPIVPSKEEIKANPRSSCAKMRVFRFK